MERTISQGLPGVARATDRQCKGAQQGTAHGDRVSACEVRASGREPKVIPVLTDADHGGDDSEGVGRRQAIIGNRPRPSR
jgi:hypothetical protein